MTVRAMTSTLNDHETTDDPVERSVWVDLERPSQDERQWFNELVGETIPGEADIAEFEASSRFFVSRNALHLRAFFLGVESDPITIAPIGLVVSDNRLITVHWTPLRAIELCQQRLAGASTTDAKPWSLALELFEAHVDTVADQIESLYERVDRQNALLSDETSALDEIIANLGKAEELNEKFRFSLMDQQQTLANLSRHHVLKGADDARLAALLTDIQSLIDHSEGILRRISLHATIVMSRTQLADSRITKAFSVVATLFLPPTLIASIYGMNFHNMPELTWPYGYALAMGLMVLSSIAPFLYFKYRRWL